MTLPEALKVTDLLSQAMQFRGVEGLRPSSLMEHRSTKDILLAFRLAVAAELQQADRDGKWTRFEKWLEAAEACESLLFVTPFVADATFKYVAALPEASGERGRFAQQVRAEQKEYNERKTADIEALATFVPYCRAIVAQPGYWAIVRARLGLQEDEVPYAVPVATMRATIGRSDAKGTKSSWGAGLLVAALPMLAMVLLYNFQDILPGVWRILAMSATLIGALILIPIGCIMMKDEESS